MTLRLVKVAGVALLIVAAVIVVLMLAAPTPHTQFVQL